VGALAASSRMLTPTRKMFRAYGRELMQSLAHAFDDARFVPAASHEYERIDLWSGFNVRFCPWGGKPYYITLYLKTNTYLSLTFQELWKQKAGSPGTSIVHFI